MKTLVRTSMRICISYKIIPITNGVFAFHLINKYQLTALNSTQRRKGAKLFLELMAISAGLFVSYLSSDNHFFFFALLR